MNPEEETIFSRLPPHSTDAEMCVIGCLMLCDGDPLVFTEVASLISGRDFFTADPQILFELVFEMWKSKKKIDSVTVVTELQTRGLLEEIGGREYIGKILYAVPSPAHYMAYTEIVAEKSKRRSMIAIGNDLIRDGYADSRTDGYAADAIASHAKQLNGVLLGGTAGKSRKLDEVLSDVYAKLSNGETTLIQTGIRELDDSIGGLNPGEMVVLAARPSMGKSLLAKQIAEQIASGGTPVGIVSLEETEEKVARNMLSSASSIDNRRLRAGQIGDHEWKQIDFGMSKLKPLPIFITQKARRIQDIKSVVCGWVVREGVKVVIIDYIQRIRGVPGKDRYETTSGISLEVSEICKENNVAMIAVAQLNRDVEHREDKHPTMADLRDSGQIEQDADGVLLLYRPDYYGMSDPNYVPNRTAEIIVAKWRDGVRGQTITLHTNMANQRFESPDTNAVAAQDYNEHF